MAAIFISVSGDVPVNTQYKNGFFYSLLSSCYSLIRILLKLNIDLHGHHCPDLLHYIYGINWSGKYRKRTPKWLVIGDLDSDHLPCQNLKRSVTDDCVVSTSSSPESLVQCLVVKVIGSEPNDDGVRLWCVDACRWKRPSLPELKTEAIFSALTRIRVIILCEYLQIHTRKTGRISVSYRG